MCGQQSDPPVNGGNDTGGGKRDAPVERLWGMQDDLQSGRGDTDDGRQKTACRKADHFG